MARPQGERPTRIDPLSAHYDQLNRLSSMDPYSGLNMTSGTFTPVQLVNNQYQERVTYDPNGNIQSYLRNGNGGSAAAAQMDNLTYYYANNPGQPTNPNPNPT